MNFINEFQRWLGPIYDPALYFGVIAMFGAPVLAFLAFKGCLTQNLLGIGVLARTFRSLGAAASMLAGIVWLGALASIFPGILACSVYCFLLLALPTLGLTGGIACTLLVLGAILAKGVRNGSKGA